MQCALLVPVACFCGSTVLTHRVKQRQLGMSPTDYTSVCDTGSFFSGCAPAAAALWRTHHPVHMHATYVHALRSSRCAAVLHLLPSSSHLFTDSMKTLYYFKTPDDVPKPNGLRGQISLVDCIIEDLDERGNTRPSIGSANVELQRGDRASLLLRIRSLDPRR